MKLATYSADGQTRTGIVVGDSVIDTGIDGTMIDLIRDWNRLKPALEAKAAAGGGVPLSSVKLEAPVQRPGKIFAIGLNYADHIAESKMATPERQVWFTKAQTSVKQAQAAGVKHLLLTHLIPYPDSFIVRRMYTEGMADHYKGKLTVGQDGMLIVL